jgi:D-glycero-D-manno-heptose 1,7-bisphosphate phosphatase
MSRIIFLDLDGTVRYSAHESGFINHPGDVRVYPEAAEQMAKFIEAGWNVCFVSNQGGIAAGHTTAEEFEAGWWRTMELVIDYMPMPTSEEFRQALRLDMLMFCPHAVDSGCLCRKPWPGMVSLAVQAVQRMRHHGSATDPIDMSQCLFVGDRTEDEGCARACGVPFIHAERWRAAVFSDNSLALDSPGPLRVLLPGKHGYVSEVDEHGPPSMALPMELSA